MNDKTMARADFVSSLVLIAFGAYVAYESWRMPRFEEQKASVWASPGLVTGILGLLFIGSGLIMVVRSVLRQGYRLSIDRAAVRSLMAEPGTGTTGFTLAMCLIYGAVLLGRMPYILATGLFVFAFIYLYEWRRGRTLRQELRAAAVALSIAAGASIVVTLVFEKLFLVTLP